MTGAELQRPSHAASVCMQSDTDDGPSCSPQAMGDPLSDRSSLIGAASSGKLRLVRLLVEGGAQVNGRGPAGETPLLAACKALRGEPAGRGTLRLLAFLLRNKADPNAQDRAGRTALMYACMERAGPQVASTLLAAGADPTVADRSGASALVYAVDAQDEATLKVLLDACQAKGRDVIIIATETGATGGPLTRRYLPSPNTPPVSCMSPSDIVLKTGSPNSPEGGNVFSFRGHGGGESSSAGAVGQVSKGEILSMFSAPAGQRGSGRSQSSRTSSSSGSSSSGGSSTPLPLHGRPPRRERVLSEPWPAIPNRACLNRQTEAWGGEGDQGGGGDRGPSRLGEEMGGSQGGSLPRISQSLVSLADPGHVTSGTLAGQKGVTPGGLSHLLRGESPPSHLRRNTLPSLQVTPPPSGVV